MDSKTFLNINRKALIGDSAGDPVDNGTPPSNVHTLLDGLTSPFQINSSGFCFQKSSTQNFCWGEHTFIGYTRPYAEDFSALPTGPAPLYGKTIDKFSSDTQTSCVVAGGKVYCWGVSAIGNSPTSNIPGPVETTGVLNGKTMKDVFVGWVRVCALDTGNDIYCWGYGSNGALGDGNGVDNESPVAVSKAGVLNGLTIKSVGMGRLHTCVIASDDKVYCWGNDLDGQLGNAVVNFSNVPVHAAMPGGLTVKSLKVSDYTNCAIASDDKVYCWGKGTLGQTGRGASTSVGAATAVSTAGVLNGLTVKSIEMNSKGVCAIASDDYVYCWGVVGVQVNGTEITSNIPIKIDQTGVLNGLTIKKVFMGNTSSCVIASDDKLYCWGLAEHGKLGNNSTVNTSVPVAVDTSGVLSGKAIIDVKMYQDNTCVRDSNQEIYCWGSNSSGQLGNNTLTSSSVPVAVLKSGQAIGKTFKTISGFEDRPCAIGSDDQLYCWGSYLMSGLPVFHNQLFPLPVYANSVSNTTLSNITFQTGYPDGTVCVQTASGDYYCKSYEFIKHFNFGVQFKKSYHFSTTTCFLGVNNLAYCMGEGVGVGNTSVPTTNFPIALDMTNVGAGVTIKDMGAGLYHACILTSNNKVYCWGTNFVGSLGNGTLANAAIPTEIDMSGVLSGKTIKALSVGGVTTCVIASDDQGYCWGFNMFGNLGDGTLVDAASPVAINTAGVLNGKLLRNVTAFVYNTCAIADDNLAYCWGANTNGTIGNGTQVDSNVPVAVDTTGVLSGRTIKGLLSGDSTICSIADDNNVYCWGLNDKGQLGNGTYVDSYVPVAVSRSGVLNNKTVKNLKMAANTSCVLASDDKVYCWGDGSANNLGNNTTTPSNIPVELLYTP